MDQEKFDGVFHTLRKSQVKTQANTLPPHTMDFGSRALLAGAPLQDLEDIYQDDVNDGIASMAKEQAEA